MSAPSLPAALAKAGAERAPRVRPLLAGDEAAWRGLWADYLLFYGADVPDEATDHSWKRLMAADDPMFGLVVELDGVVVGFANCALQGSSWSVLPTCYLEDLFVASHQRRGGAGRALLDELVALGRANGWRALCWHTQADNTTARKLYDRVGTTDDVVRYTAAITR